MVMRSNLRWCSDGLEFTCWNGEVVRLAFIIDAFDRERDEHPTFPLLTEAARYAPSSTGAERNGWRSR